MKKQAKLYNQIGWWKFYKTVDGYSFTARDSKDYWYNGNVVTSDKSGSRFIEKEHHEALFEEIEFVE